MPTQFDCQYPEVIRNREREMVAARRAAAGATDGPPVGLALSGGGIRSATFSLGFLQGLAGAGLLPRLDFLSTVSGGGYIGAFLGALYARRVQPDVQAVEATLTNPSSPEVRWLRDNGRYLAPNGGGDKLLAAATISRNWTAVMIVMATLLMALLLGAHAIRAWLGAAWPVDGPATAVIAIVHRIKPWHGIYWSSYLLAPLAVFVFAAVPFGWGYWLGRGQNVSNLWVWGAMVLIALLAFVQRPAPAGVAIGIYHGALLLFGTLASIALAIAVGLSVRARGDKGPASGDRLFRNQAARGLTGCLMAVAALAAFGLVDTLGQSLYVLVRSGGSGTRAGLSTAAAVLAGLVTTAQKRGHLFGEKGGTRVRLPVAVVAGLAALVVATIAAAAVSAASQGVARRWRLSAAFQSVERQVEISLSEPEHHIVVQQTERGVDPELPPAVGRDAAFWAGIFAVVALLVGRRMSFVNLSSLSTMYAARLSRAYLGASNPNRQREGGRSLTEEVEHDDLSMREYAPHANGGPLHVINVTLNETISGESQIEYRDRKGLPMAVGPAGISVGVRHHGLWADADRQVLQPVRAQWSAGTDRNFHIWSHSPSAEPDSLRLSVWTAISGAAVSPGLGARTSLAVSLLLGLANVRLGYWWMSDSQRTRQGGARPKLLTQVKRWFARIFPAQSALLQELLAQFDGPHQQYWFLSDGGHFENTACYELLRRRVPIIVVCDNGADPDYGFEDLATLVRIVRTDFAVDVQVVGGRDSAHDIGALSDLRRRTPGPPQPGEERGRSDLGARLASAHATLAIVRYTDPVDHSLIVWVKPTLVGDEPVDILQYAAAHPDFPQETTSDQFFDEAQWESYRKLGEHIAERLLTGLDLENLRATTLTAI